MPAAKIMTDGDHHDRDRRAEIRLQQDQRRRSTPTTTPIGSERMPHFVDAIHAPLEKRRNEDDRRRSSRARTAGRRSRPRRASGCAPLMRGPNSTATRRERHEPQRSPDHDRLPVVRGSRSASPAGTSARPRSAHVACLNRIQVRSGGTVHRDARPTRCRPSRRSCRPGAAWR